MQTVSAAVHAADDEVYSWLTTSVRVTCVEDLFTSEGSDSRADQFCCTPMRGQIFSPVEVLEWRTVSDASIQCLAGGGMLAAPRTCTHCWQILTTQKDGDYRVHIRGGQLRRRLLWSRLCSTCYGYVRRCCSWVTGRRACGRCFGRGDADSRAWRVDSGLIWEGAGPKEGLVGHGGLCVTERRAGC